GAPGAPGAALRASRGGPELWAARGWRAALPVPRLAIRRDRQVPGAARRAGWQHVQGPRAPARLSVYREGAGNLRLSRPRGAAAAAQLRILRGARRPRVAG